MHTYSHSTNYYGREKIKAWIEEICQKASAASGGGVAAQRMFAEDLAIDGAQHDVRPVLACDHTNHDQQSSRERGEVVVFVNTATETVRLVNGHTFNIPKQLQITCKQNVCAKILVVHPIRFYTQLLLLQYSQTAA